MLEESDLEKVQGRSFTSNNVKLLKHLDKLSIIQKGGTPSPVMVHMSICNPCNLTCSFCCFANRAMKEMLTLDQMKSAIDQFRELGATGLEFTGGGEPTLHPKFDEIAKYAHDAGFAIGVCTNGTRLNKIKTWEYFSWVRLGMYGFTEGYEYDLSALREHNTQISGAFIWDYHIETSDNPNITGKWSNTQNKKLSKNFQKEDTLFKMIEFVEREKIPTRIAFNAIKPVPVVEKDIETLRGLLSGLDLKYAFLSDFNYKGHRRNDHCYMHMVKPFVFTDGNVYVCPCAEFSPENNYNVNEEFKLCDIDGILDFYKQGVTRRHHGCSFCKFADQNELVDDILTETENNEFA